MLLQTRFDLLSTRTHQLGFPRLATVVRKMVVGVLATAFIALCAHISVVSSIMPIPITMQTFAVLLVGMVLNPSEALVVLVFYLLEGALGFPVFSPHGFGGVAQLSGPSGGYLLSYPFAALLAGVMFSNARRYVSTFYACLIAAVIADSVILSLGAVWLGGSLRLSLGKALELGVLPFLAGEAVKILLIATTIISLQVAKRVE